MRQFPDGGKRRRDRCRTGRAGRGALAAVAGIQADDLRSGSGAGRPVDRATWPQWCLADHAHQHQSRPDRFQRPRARDRQRVPVRPRHPRLPGSLCRDVRAHVAHPVQHTGRAPQQIRRRMAGASLRHDRALRQGRGGNRQVPVPRHPARSGARHVRRFGWRDLHMPVPGPRTLLRQACARRGRRDQRALEIAAELAQLGATHVVVTQRRQRYVLPKFAAGVPSDHRIFTRYGAIANEHLPAAEIDRQLKEIVVEAGGSPEQYGAPAPDPSLFAAGVTLSQQYLPLVAEGRITVRPWPASITNTAVTFSDGSAGEFDGIVFGTGFDLHLPFLSQDICAALDLDAVHMDADRYTFRPDLPGLAFVGMWDQSGGYFVPLELQARWIAYTWGGAISPMSAAAQWSSIDAYRLRRGTSQKIRMNLAALAFARAAGVEPRLENWPHLRRALLFGPLAPSYFRLEGPDALPDAPARFARDAAVFGAITSNELTEREQMYWSMVTGATPTELSAGDRSS